MHDFLHHHFFIVFFCTRHTSHVARRSRELKQNLLLYEICNRIKTKEMMMIEIKGMNRIKYTEVKFKSVISLMTTYSAVIHHIWTPWKWNYMMRICLFNWINFTYLFGKWASFYHSSSITFLYRVLHLQMNIKKFRKLDNLLQNVCLL